MVLITKKVMKKTISPHIGTLCFRNISETAFLGALRASNYTRCERSKFFRKFINSDICSYLLLVRARFIVNDVIGKHSERDINRMVSMFPEDRTLVSTK